MKKAARPVAGEMGFVFSAFAWSYVLAQLPGGWLLDRFGSKITYFFSIFLWSLFTMLMGGVGFFTGAAAVALLFACACWSARPKRLRSPATAASRRPGSPPPSGAPRRDLQLGPVFRHRAVRAADGLAGAHLRLAERVLRDGRASASRWPSSG
jgi:hypothetical protein